jgi:hypothetical protein
MSHAMAAAGPEIDIYTTPGLEEPAGITSNLVNPYSTHRELVITSALCLSFALSAVLARIFTKIYVLKKMQIEDCRCFCRDEYFPQLTNGKQMLLVLQE